MIYRKIGKMALGTIKCVAGGAHFAICIVSRTIAGPITKTLSPDLKPNNIIETSGYWIKDGIKDIEMVFRDEKSENCIAGSCPCGSFLLRPFIISKNVEDKTERVIIRSGILWS